MIRLVEKTGVKMHCLNTTKDGHPAHPLYQPLNAKPIAFRM